MMKQIWKQAIIVVVVAVCSRSEPLLKRLHRLAASAR